MKSDENTMDTDGLKNPNAIGRLKNACKVLFGSLAVIFFCLALFDFNIKLYIAAIILGTTSRTTAGALAAILGVIFVTLIFLVELLSHGQHF